MEETRKDYV